MNNDPNATDKEVLDPTNSGRMEDPQEANKRAALAGQWRTPPMPAYPSGYTTAPIPGGAPHPHHHQQQQPPPVQAGPHVSVSHTDSADELMDLPNPSTLPGTSEDYAKALQEAYRKGAEAAARMAQLPTAASCPNFHTGPHVAPPPAIDPSSAGVYHQPQHQIHPPPPQATQTAIPDPLSSTMPPPPPPHSGAPAPAIAMTTYAPAPVPQHTATTVTYAYPPQTSQPPPPLQQQQQQQQHIPQQHMAAPPGPPPTHPHTAVGAPAPNVVTSGVATHAGHAPPTKPPPGRSLSMPDMSAYAAKAEEEKRQKRLARNRASARLRRLRKKNLVDAYETEVGILEKTLKQLQAHEWGKDDDHKTLLDALGMERGQQVIGPEQRTEIIRDILKQQMQQVELLRQAQMEQECLVMVANMDENGGDELARELQDLLQLTEEQKAELRESSKGLDKEVKALETVAASLQAMEENDWLLNEGVQKITDQFISILHKNQQSKFLLWADANAEAIDQLDHVQVQPLQNAPIFSFGVETGPGDDDDK